MNIMESKMRCRIVAVRREGKQNRSMLLQYALASGLSIGLLFCMRPVFYGIMYLLGLSS
jgi:hypothetical protein